MPVASTGVKTDGLDDYEEMQLVAAVTSVLVLAMFAISAPAATAATMTVTTTVDANDDDSSDGVCQTAPGGPCSLRAALDEARGNGNVEPDLITLPAGDFRLTLGQLEIANSGTVKITGAGAALTTIRQTGLDRVLLVKAPGDTPSLHGLTIRGGRLPADSVNASGAGIYSILGIRLDRVVLYDNQVTGTSSTGAGRAGGLYVVGDEVRIERTRIARNEAPHSGGAEIQTSELLIANSVIEENTGSTGSGGLSIFVRSGAGNQGRISNTAIVGNRAPDGHPGGLSGGGSTTAPMPTVTIENSLVADNFASAGAGGWALGGSYQAEVYNSTFSGNVDGLGGAGAIRKEFGSGPPLLLSHVTLTGNPGAEATPLLRHQGGDAFSLFRTLVDGACAPAGSAGFTADSSTLFRDSSCGGTASGPLGLGPLADNGGPTHTHALLADSRALDGVASG